MELEDSYTNRARESPYEFIHRILFFIYHGLLDFPEEEGSYGIAKHNRIHEACDLVIVPYIFSLDCRKIYFSAIYITDY